MKESQRSLRGKVKVQDFGKTRNLSKNFIFKFFPKLCCLSKIDCTLTKLIVSVENVETFSRKLLCSLVKRASTFDRQCLF